MNQVDSPRPEHCPQCGRSQLERVRAVVNQETTGYNMTQLAQNLQPPYYSGTFGKGTVVLMVFVVLFNLFSFTSDGGSPAVGILLDIIVAVILGIRLYLGNKKREALEEMLSIWERLFYCRIDDIVISADEPDQYAPSARWFDLT